MLQLSLILMVIIIPVIFALIGVAFKKHSLINDTTMIIGAFISSVFNIYLLSLFNIIPIGALSLKEGFNLYEPYVLSTIYENFHISFSMEPIGAIFIMLVSVLWPITSIYSVGYMRIRKEDRTSTFNLYLQLSIASTFGIAMAGDLFTMFMFYELLTLSTFPLVLHSRTGNALNSAQVYLGYLLTTSTLFILPMIVWIAFRENTLSFGLNGILYSFSDSEKIILATIMILGVGKVALFPFHRWLPAAMVAPTPASAILHAVAVVKSGALVVIKIIVYVFGFSAISYGHYIIALASASIIIAGLMAVHADNLKAKLAYSTIHNLAYIVLAAALFNKYGIYAAIIQLISHALGKITLFFVSGSITTVTHHTNVSAMGGIARQMPISLLCFAIAALSLMGLPVFIGFYAKFSMLNAIVLSFDGFFMWLIIGVIVIGSLLSALTYLPVIYVTLFKAPSDLKIAKNDASLAMLIPVIITAGLCIAFFFFGSWFSYLNFDFNWG